MMKRLEAFLLALLVGMAVLTLPVTNGRAEATSGQGVAQTAVQAMFLNVGKADAALFCLGEQRYLIDTGTKDSADAMLRALAYFGIEKLDGVLITHIDSDHVGGLKALLKSGMVVDRLYAATFHNAKSLEKHPVVKQAEKYDIPMTWLNAGDVIERERHHAFCDPLGHSRMTKRTKTTTRLCSDWKPPMAPCC